MYVWGKTLPCCLATIYQHGQTMGNAAEWKGSSSNRRDDHRLGCTLTKVCNMFPFCYFLPSITDAHTYILLPSSLSWWHVNKQNNTKKGGGEEGEQTN